MNDIVGIIMAIMSAMPHQNTRQAYQNTRQECNRPTVNRPVKYHNREEWKRSILNQGMEFCRTFPSDPICRGKQY